MGKASFSETIDEICAKDPRYHHKAYLFVQEALDFTAKQLKKPATGEDRHVSGKELLGGVRDFALSQFGPMAMTVLQTWGIQRTEDVGEIVFNLVDAGRFGRRETDGREDFADGFDFHTAFVEPFQPPAPTDDPRPAPSSPEARPRSKEL